MSNSAAGDGLTNIMENHTFVPRARYLRLLRRRRRYELLYHSVMRLCSEFRESRSFLWLDCLAFTIRVLRKSATFGWSWSFRRYRLMRIQHARVRLAISTDISGISVTAPPRIAPVCRFARPLRLAPSSAVYAVEACHTNQVHPSLPGNKYSSIPASNRGDSGHTRNKFY